MSELDELIRVLKNGKNNAKHADMIAKALDMDVGKTHDPTRDLIRTAIIDEGFPIGSTPQVGFFLIDSEDELKEVIKGFEQRIEGLQKRIEALNAGWERRLKSRASGGNWPK